MIPITYETKPGLLQSFSIAIVDLNSKFDSLLLINVSYTSSNES